MIISPPFLPSQAGHEMDSADAGNTLVPDHDVCAAGMQECAPGNGAYPVSYNLGWHGGPHLIAPSLNGQAEPVRAIADGMVVYVRKTSPGGIEALQYRNVRTDDGCVVIKHTTEIGEGESAKVTFFSIYMHLQSVVGAITVGKPVYRKDKLGIAGQIYGQSGQMHFEIVCDEANLQKLVGRTTGPLVAQQGRKDAIFGDIWFKVSKGTKVFEKEPHPYRRDDSEPPLGPHPSVQPQRPVATTGSDMFIRMHYEKTCTFTTYRMEADGRIVQLGEALPSATNYEYELYDEASRLNKMYRNGTTAPANPSPKAPSPSLIFELLRFGRAVGETMPSDVKFGHWRRVVTPDATGWINLNQPTIGVYSDADFPHWADWSLIDDDHTPDSHCDSPSIRKWLDLTGKGRVTHAEAKEALLDKAVAKKLARAICKFPIEWTKQDIGKRWGWLKASNEALPGPLSDTEFSDLENHITALAFWDDIPKDRDLPDANECWHLPPVEFIRQFRKCGWLTSDELTRMFPATALRYQAARKDRVTHALVPGHWVSEKVTPNKVNISKYCIELNKAMRKFLITTPLRQAAFLGNAMQETQWFSLIEEGGATGQKYFPWSGRGFLQLTWPDNYVAYWRFRGRQVDEALADALRRAAVSANKSGSNATLVAADLKVPTVAEEWRRNTATDTVEATDSAGAYWSWSGAASNADRMPLMHRESKPVGNTQKPYYSSQSFGLVAATVNVGHPSTAFSQINGLQARYQAYTAALVQLMDIMQFPGANGAPQSLPDA